MDGSMNVCIIFSVTVFVVVAAEKGIHVTTSSGTFIGVGDKIELHLNKTEFRLLKFLGIPYAEAPVGNYRFRKPVPKAPLREPFHAKRFGSPCMQVMSVPNPQHGSEDCLYLNIYAPERTSGSEEKIPVMVYIHGGGLVLGSANTFIPDRLVANGPVILVTFNYRLSIWGFLSTADSNSPGNYGLWDQHLAIQWVHDNIDSFGGDPNRVTIFGESSGSTSVIYQGLYAGNKGLFQRIIAQSGSPFAVWGKARAPVTDARDFASLVGCKTDANAGMVECLRSLDADIINNTLNDFSNGIAFRPMVFIPYPDNDFIVDFPTDSINDFITKHVNWYSVFSSFDLLTGVTSGEAYLFTPPSPWKHEEHDKFRPTREFFETKLIPGILNRFILDNCKEVMDAVVREYTDWSDPENPEKIREKYCDIPGDLLFLEPMWRTANLHANIESRQSTYMYSFTAMPSSHYYPTPPWASRPNHGDDLIYVFGGEADTSEFGTTDTISLKDWEVELSDKVMTMWTNFAKTGNPNKPRDICVDWLPYTNSHQHYLDISKTLSHLSVKMHLERRRVDFWNKIVPSIIKRCRQNSSSDNGVCRKDEDCKP